MLVKGATGIMSAVDALQSLLMEIVQTARYGFLLDDICNIQINWTRPTLKKRSSKSAKKYVIIFSSYAY